MTAHERQGVGSARREPHVDATSLYRFIYLLALTGHLELRGIVRGWPAVMDPEAVAKLLAADRANPEAGIVECLAEMVPARLLRGAADTAEAIERSVTPELEDGD